MCEQQDAVPYARLQWMAPTLAGIVTTTSALLNGLMSHPLMAVLSGAIAVLAFGNVAAVVWYRRRARFAQLGRGLPAASADSKSGSQN